MPRNTRRRIEKRNAYEGALYSYKTLAKDNPELTQYIEAELEWISRDTDASVEEYESRLNTLLEKVKTAIPAPSMDLPPEVSMPDEGVGQETTAASEPIIDEID